jgi:hypothetical protein
MINTPSRASDAKFDDGDFMFALCGGGTINAQRKLALPQPLKYLKLKAVSCCLGGRRVLTNFVFVRLGCYGVQVSQRGTIAAQRPC